MVLSVFESQSGPYLNPQPALNLSLGSSGLPSIPGRSGPAKAQRPHRGRWGTEAGGPSVRKTRGPRKFAQVSCLPGSVRESFWLPSNGTENTKGSLDGHRWWGCGAACLILEESPLTLTVAPVSSRRSGFLESPALNRCAGFGLHPALAWALQGPLDMEGVSGAFQSVLADLDDIIAKSNKVSWGVWRGTVRVFRDPVFYQSPLRTGRGASREA